MAEQTKYKLSDLDKSGFHMEVPLLLFYQISPEVNVQELLSSLKAGLNNALGALPFMTGELQLQENGELCIIKDENSKLEFDINQVNSTGQPSFSDLARTSFAPDQMGYAKYLPAAATDRKPACLLKLSLLEGGLVLGARINHATGDWFSIDRFLSLIFQGCKAHREGAEMPTFTPDLNRGPFNTPLDAAEYTRQESVEKLQFFYVMEKSQWKPPAGSLSSFEAKIYRVDGATLKALKGECLPYLREGGFVSSYDVLSALIWTSITRARLHLDPTKKGCLSRLIQPIDVRSRDPGHTSSEHYFGNAVIATQAGPINSDDFTSEDDPVRGLALAAATIRKSTKAVDISLVNHLTSLRSSLGPTEMMGSHADFTNMDVFVNTWALANIERYDLGHGVAPVALRMHTALPGACAVILPTLPRSSERAFDLHLQASTKEHDFLKNDVVFSKYIQSF
ncbi:transferase [Penicillium diatomitis]|uniref:Transferase n=1 Tax=Penicillium diatomitis TaxID=2819901 RepID=A0A9X0BSU2_9EURO|nr:transferase [Penicillium diatomitis]KAJ5482887.1 transferase [Penicillium diatomitis]